MKKILKNKTIKIYYSTSNQPIKAESIFGYPFDKNLPLTVHLFILFNDKVNPIIIIKYIVENLDGLIEESYDVEEFENIVYVNLCEAYKNYYESEIKKEKWLKSLFPPSIEKLLLSDIYIGIVGKVAACSYSNKDLHLYSDPVDWSISWWIEINKTEKSVNISGCKYYLIDKVYERQIDLLVRENETRLRPVILYKKYWWSKNCWDNEEAVSMHLMSCEEWDEDYDTGYDSYSYNELKEELMSRIAKYKENINSKTTAGYDEEIEKVFNTVVKDDIKGIRYREN